MHTMHTCMYVCIHVRVHVCMYMYDVCICTYVQLIAVARWSTWDFNSTGEDKESSSPFILSRSNVSSNYLKSPKPREPSHRLFSGEDKIFGPPKGAWFTMKEDDLNLVLPDLNSSSTHERKKVWLCRKYHVTRIFIRMC